MKKLLALLLALVMCASVLTACGAKESAAPAQEAAAAPAEEAAASAEEPKKVVFMVNGSLGDKGFFDSCAEGINRLGSEYGCEVKIIEMGRDETTYETYFRDVSDQDWDLIVAATWSVQEVFEEVAADYPDNNYLFIDGVTASDNMIGVTFRSHETSFMAGCLAALQLKAGGDKIDPEQNIVGVVASMDTTSLNEFVVGYIQGVNYIDESIKVLTSYVGSFEDVATCLEMTTQLYNQGAQIVYAPASQSVIGAVTASDNCDKYFIGCDTDLYIGLADTDEKLVRNVLSTSLKKMGDAVVNSALGLWDGSVSVGENYSMGLAENAVGLADHANYQALVSEDVRAELDKIAQDVIDGKIQITSAAEMETEEIVAMRDAKKP